MQSASGHPRGVAFRAPPKNSAQRSGCQNAPRALGRVGYSLGEGCRVFHLRDSELGNTLRAASGYPRRVTCKAPPKNIARSSRCQNAPGPQDRQAKALVGGEAGVFCPRDSKWGKALRGALRCPLAIACKAPPKNSAQRSGCQKALGALRRVVCSLGGVHFVHGTQNGARLSSCLGGPMGCPV